MYAAKLIKGVFPIQLNKMQYIRRAASQVLPAGVRRMGGGGGAQISRCVYPCSSIYTGGMFCERDCWKKPGEVLSEEGEDLCCVVSLPVCRVQISESCLFNLSASTNCDT